MEQVKLKSTFRDLIKDFFGVNHDIEEDLTKELKENQLYDTMKKVDQEAEAFNTPVHSEENKSSNGGFSKKIEINPKTLEKMRTEYQKSVKEREGRE